MNSFDQRVLQALVTLNQSSPIRRNDADIFTCGETLFGEKWTAERDGENAAYPSYPAISMSLGRLQKLGLVIRHEFDGYSYGLWELVGEV